MTDAIAWVTGELLVQVGGDDGRTWLNGQMTGDLKTLSPAQPVYGLILNVKGRILSDALAIDHPEHGLLMAVPRDAWAVLSPHLEHYIIMEDVALTPREDLRLVTVQGARPPHDLGGAAWLPHARLGAEGYDAVVAVDAIDATKSALAAIATVLDEADVEPRRIRAGAPRFAHDFGDTTYPQEAGLEKRAVSFQKGCYLGQEVICMLESRGQVSRRLVQVRSDGELSRGEALLGTDGAKVGEITSATSDAGGAIALALVKRALAKEGEPLGTERGGRVTVLAPTG